MAALRGCARPGCDRWMRWDQWACDECNGTNARQSYHKRTNALVACISAAAIEEMRYRRTLIRLLQGRE